MIIVLNTILRHRFLLEETNNFVKKQSEDSTLLRYLVIVFLKNSR